MPTIGHLSESTDGAPISITATATAGTTVHTATSATDQIDMLHLFAANNHTAAVEIEVEHGQTTAANNIVVTIPADSGLVRITPENGLPLQNSKTCAIFAGTTAVIAIYGYVIRSTAAEAFN